MIRIISDKLGDGHHDLFLKIDVMPVVSKTADSYYLFDFFEISDDAFEKSNTVEGETIRYGVVELLKYWIARISSMESGDKKFIPFDLSDEYIGGLMLEKTKLGFKIKIVYTDKIQGYAVTKSSLDQRINDGKIDFLNDGQEEWVIGEDALIKGLNWNMDDLKQSLGSRHRQ